MSDVFFGVSHLDVPVTSAARAKRLYHDVLGFPVRRQGTGYIDLDASSLLLRLVEVARPEQRIAFRVHVGDVDLATRRLVDAGARLLYEPNRSPDLELWSSVHDFDGNTLTLWRPLTEDEYGFVPELPTERRWSPEAEALLKSLLMSVPALFRALARRKVVRVVEELAEGAPAVQELHVVRGYILASARVTRYRAREPLRKHGFDPDRFQADFESP